MAHRLNRADLSAPKSQRFLRFAIAMPIVADPRNLGARQKGDSKWEKPVSAKICGFLRLPAKICGFLRKSAPPKSLDLQSEPKISENLQKSAKMCFPGLVSPFCCLLFGAPRIAGDSLIFSLLFQISLLTGFFL